MRVGVAEARRRFAELLDRAMRGETVEIARRHEVVAVIGPPQAVAAESLSTVRHHRRRSWGVGSWAAEDPRRAPRAFRGSPAVAVVNGLRLVTRDVADFANFADLSVENWFI